MSEQTSNQNAGSQGSAPSAAAPTAPAPKPQPPVPPQPPVTNAPPPPPQPTTAPSAKNNIRAMPQGWRFQRSNPGTFADVSKVVNNRVIDPTKIYKGGITPHFASNTVESPASIVELARALKNDPQLIFEHVYNNVDWQPGWGVMKGPLGCLMDGSGNAFDQSMLLVALLRQAGFTANYVLGQIQLTEAQFDAWFNTNSAWCAYWYAQYANIPGDTPVWDGTEYTMVMSHVWVEVVVGGNTYSLDPSLKTYTRKSPVSGLDTILGYNAATFLSDAESGATIDVSGNYVQNMNTANIASDLTTMTSNLVSYINSNTVGAAPAGTATVDDVLGGQAIVPITLPFTWNTSLSYEAPGDTPTIWTGDVPLIYKTTLEVQYPLSTGGWAIDETFTSDQLAGSRLTLTFDSGLHPVLSLNGTVLATGSEAQTLGFWNSIQLTVNHNAYASPVYPQQWWQSFLYPGQFYLIGNAWGGLGRGQADFHQKQLAAAMAASSPTDEAINGEWMSTIWFNWAGQASKVADLVGRLNSTNMNFFHQVGMVSYTVNSGIPTPGTDIGGVSGFSSTLNYDFTQLSRTNTVVAMHGVALEAASLAQFNGIKPGVSTTTVIDKANRTANITIGGIVTVGDILTVTVHDPALAGGTKAENYTVLLGDTLTSIATAMAAEINGDSSLSDIGVTATSTGALIMVSSTSVNQTSYTSSTSGGATETITIAFEKIYLANSSNWMTGINIASILSANGYSSGDISGIDSYVSSGFESVMVGDTPGLTLGTFVGWGDWIFPNYSSNGGAYGLINNVSKGGEGQPGAGVAGTSANPVGSPGSQSAVGDPISLGTGDFIHSNNDLSIGSGDAPYSITMQRFYNSASQYSNGVLGRGWSHGFDLSAAVGNDGLLSMGEQFAAQGAASIAELYVSMDLASDSSQPVDKLVTMSLSDKWWVDQLINNTVIVATPQDTFVFVKQPDGTYTASGRNPSVLTLSSGAYTATSPQQVQSNFNSAGQISTIVYPNGVTLTFTYTSGLLTSVTNGMGRTLTLNYTSGLLTSVTDGTGRSVSYTIDGSSNLTTFEDANGNNTTYSYDNPGRMTAYFLPANPSTAFATNVYDSLSRVQTQANARSQVWSYYFAGARSEVDDPVGNNTVSYFNNLGAITRSIDALSFEVDNVYDGLNRLIQTTLPEGNQVLWTYDANNNPLTKTQVPKSGSGLSTVVETFTYDPTWAKVASYEDGNSNTTTYAYDGTTGNLLTIERPVIGVLTPTVTLTWNGRGQVLTSEDETGIVTKFTYDATLETMASQIEDYSAGVGHLNLTTSLGYDSVGNCTSITDPNTNQTTLVFDDLRRMTQQTEPSPFSYVTNFNYDDNSNLLNIQRQTGGSPAWQIYSFTYSATNEMLTAVDPASNATTWTFDGADRVQTMTDAQSREWQYAYDALNRINQTTDPSSTVCDTRTFTNNRKLASIEDARSNITQFTYDGLDRPNKTIYADSTFEQMSSYDANGNGLIYFCRSGNEIVFTFDVLNRMITKSPTSQPEITYTYDLAGRLVQASKPVVAGDPSSGALVLSFDTAGRFDQEEYPDGKTVTHVLDANGNRTKTTWPDGYFVSRTFDEMNRLTAIKLNGSATTAVAFSYNELSQRTQLTYSNGATVVYTPQLNEDVTTITHNFVGSSVEYTYGFNNVHEPTSMEVSDSSYMYHPAAASTTYNTADNVNKYPVVGGNTFSYDGNMNLTGDGTWTYTFDTENQMLTASKTGTSASFVYDPTMRQTQKTVGSTKSRYIYSEWQRIADYDGVANTLQNRYVYGTSLDEPLIEVSSSGVLTFLHADKMGTIVATSDSTGAVIDKNLFGPFGEITTLSGTTFGFTGQRFDSELDLYYLKNRYYSPTLGRFLQPDSVGYTGGDFNLYSYVQNSPLLYTDPLGLDPTLSAGPTMYSPGNNPGTITGNTGSRTGMESETVPGSIGTGHQTAPGGGTIQVKRYYFPPTPKPTIEYPPPRKTIILDDPREVHGTLVKKKPIKEIKLTEPTRKLDEGKKKRKVGYAPGPILVMVPPQPPLGGWGIIAYYPPAIQAVLLAPTYVWVWPNGADYESYSDPYGLA